MESSSTLRFMLLSFLFLASAAFSGAHIADFDSYWQKRAEEANHYARRSYNPDPESVTRQFNQLVGEDLEKNKKKGRGLRGANRISSLCQATNPIDRCWRCRSDWADLRKQLAECAQGFGRYAGGGKAGEFYVVTDASDSDIVNPKPGTLRFGVVQDRPLWIVFARDMVIRLAEELIVTSNKTIDGRGADVRIAGGAGIKLQFVHNVILHGLHIHDIKAGNGGMVRDSESHVGLRTRSDGDGISIFGSSNIWIDHVSMSNCMDGLIDAVQSSTAITISNCHLTQHNDAMLFGESDSYSGDWITQITVAFNHFGTGLVKKMPRCRWGFCHIVNNEHNHWMMDAIGGSKHPTILSQGNKYTAPAIQYFAKEASEERKHATESENGASSAETGSPELKQEFSSKEHEVIGNYVSRLTRFAGALDCVANQQC